MKIEYINHACLLITINKKKILTDPWLKGPCWAENLWLFPKADHKANYYKNIDLVYFSHGHEDHLHKESIQWLPPAFQKTPVITADFGKGAEYLTEDLNKLGFKDVTYLKNNQEFKFSNDIKIKLYVNKKDHDSSILIKANQTTLLHQTDNIFSTSAINQIKKNKIDIFFTLTSRTGPFPGFYKMKSKEKINAARNKLKDSQNISLNIVKKLQPKYVIPNASDICYFNDEKFANIFHKDNKTSYKRLLNKKNPASEVLIMYPHDKIYLDNGKIIKNEISKKNIQKDRLESFKKQKKLINKVKSVRKNDNKKNIRKYGNKLLKSINHLNHSWPKGKFHILWIIINDNKDKIYIYQNAGIECKYEEAMKHRRYNLVIEIDLYRIKHLFEKKYAMGFMSLWNGGFRCERKANYTSKEKFFWQWIFNLNFDIR